MDVAALTGLPVIGSHVSALLPLRDDIPFHFQSKKTFQQFLRDHARADDSVPDLQEHIAFMLFLICRYMVCLSGKSFAGEFIPLAKALAMEPIWL